MWTELVCPKIARDFARDSSSVNRAIVEAIYANYGKEVERIFCLAARAAQWLRGCRNLPRVACRGRMQVAGRERELYYHIA